MKKERAEKDEKKDKSEKKDEKKDRIIEKPIYEEKNIFKLAKPSLIFLLIIDKLHSLLKKPSGIPSPPTLEFSHKPEEQWIVQLNNSLKEGLSIADKMMDILGSYEDMLLFEDFREFFDDLGLLKIILSNSPSEFEYLIKMFHAIDEKAFSKLL